MVQSTHSPENNPAFSVADSHITPDDLIPVAAYARQNQTAVLVVLFTDIKGSTELTEFHGEEFARKLRHTHDELLRSVFERDNGGQLIKKIGDSLMYVFAKPSDAVARALEAQSKLHDYNSARPNEPSLTIRIGMHMGQVLVEKDVDIDVFGRHVNRAARVESLADGGQVLTTHAVYDSARGWLAGDLVSWHDHGDYLLKGISEPTRIVEACAEGVKPRRPPGRRISGSSPWMFATTTVILLAMLFSTSLMYRTPPSPTIEVSVRRSESLVLPLAKTAPLSSGDEIQVRAEFHRPVFGAIMLVDEDGVIEMLTTSGDKRVSSLTFPSDFDSWVKVSGGKGTEMLIALESAKPIVKTPEVLTQHKWELPQTPTSKETWWITPDGVKIAHDGQTVVDRGLSEVQHHETHDLRLQVDKLRHVLKDQSFRTRHIHTNDTSSDNCPAQK